MSRRFEESYQEALRAAAAGAHGARPRPTVNLTVTTEMLARAMYPEGGLSAYNQGVYPGTRIPLRKMTGKEVVSIQGTSSGAVVVSDETWICDRFGPLGSRQIKRLLAIAANSPR